MVDHYGASYNISELVIWSAEEYTTMQFSEHFRRGLPLLCRVTEGYSGRDETAHTVGKDEMFWIFEIYSQPRITFIDEMSRQISIPLDYRHRFQIVGESDRASACHEFPRRMIELVPLLEPGNTRLVIENNKRVSFGLGADRKEMASLGLIRFKERRDVDFLIGYPLIEEFLHPVPVLLPTYVPAEMRVALGFQYGNSVDFNKFTTEMKKAVGRFAKLPAEMCNDMIIFSEDVNSDTDSLYLYPPHDDTEDPPEPPCTPHPDDHPQRPTAAKPVMMRRTSSGKDKPFPLPPMPRPLPQIETVPDKEVVITYFKHYDTTGKVTTKTGPLASAPPIPPRRPGTGAESPFNQRRKTKDMVQIDEEEPDVVEATSQTPPPPPPPPTAATYNDWLERPSDVRLDPSPSGSRGGVLRGQGTAAADRRRRYWQIVADIPLFVSTFTIDEVCYCLEALNMERYTERFVDNHVDGELLVSLNENILQTTFDFTEFDAIKLMKFARDGWRPRVGKNQDNEYNPMH